MAKTPTLYVCKNIPACPLGTPQQLGRFTDGMSAQGKHLLTGTPLDDLVEGKDYGEGICPNCGTKGEPWDAGKAKAAAIAEAKEQHKERLAVIEEGVA